MLTLHRLRHWLIAHLHTTPIPIVAALAGLALVFACLLVVGVQAVFADGPANAIAMLLIVAALFLVLGWLGLMAVVRLEAAHTAPEPFRGTTAFAAGLLVTFVFWGVTAWALVRLLMVLIDPNALAD